MVEGSKQVRVDNWGIFFLQRLQMFFSKTDYCDLTLQFEGNVQLKVHRLVMNACTEYFTFLEQTCPAVEENTIMMPTDLQADVIVPIVNFMYTGMLEFHVSIFEKLYKAAKLMNITVLTKLLDAQKIPLQAFKQPKKKTDIPHTWNLQGKKISAKTTSTPELPATLPGRKLPVWKRKNAPSIPMQHPSSQLHFTDQKWTQDPLSVPDNAPKPTRFEWPDDDLPPVNLMDTSFEEISYTSKPLLTQEEESRASTSFDEIRNNVNGHPKKCTSKVSSGSINIKDIEEHVREQKIRSDLTNLEQGEGDYDYNQKRKLDQSTVKSPKRIKVNDKENKETTISIKSNSTTELDHTKIVSEILKKYPQLVKKNKNIRLKIMTSGNKHTADDKIHGPTRLPKINVQEETVNKLKLPDEKLQKEKQTFNEEGPWHCVKCIESGESVQEFVLYYLYRKHMTDVHNELFDLRLCKYCGRKCGKHSLMMYHLYTKHGLKPPASYNFPKCDQCPYIAISDQKLAKHKLQHDPNEMQCIDCKLAFTSQQTLTAHIQITGHFNTPGRSNYDCQYCTKKLQSPINLFTHIKNSHMKEARKDGIVSLDEIEEAEVEEEEAEEEVKEEEEYIVPETLPDTTMQKDKVKIISNVKVPARSEQGSSNSQYQNIPLEPSSEAEALSNVASGIATSLGLVDIVVLDDNQQYILQQQENQTGQTEFILPELSSNEHPFSSQVITTQHSSVLPQGMLQSSGSDIASTDELVMVLTDHDYQDEQEGATTDNSNIVVLYSHPVDGQQGQFITSQGNLLVNSQTGMLEIRNGATIATTTASPMVMNNAADAPIESIEMIQREIEGHSDIKQEQFYEEERKLEVTNDHRDSVQLLVEENVPQQPQEENQTQEEAVATDIDCNQTQNESLDETTSIPQGSGEVSQDMPNLESEEVQSKEEEEEQEDRHVSQDYIDGTTKTCEEPMEIDELPQAPQDATYANQESVPTENLETALAPEVPEQSEPAQPEEVSAPEEDPGIDVPPNTDSTVTTIPLYNTSETLVMNDPTNLYVNCDIGEKDKSESIAEAPEPMEVDGATNEESRLDETGVEEKGAEQSSEEQIQECDNGQTEDASETEKGDDSIETEHHEPQEEASQSTSEFHHQSETSSQYNDEDEHSKSSQDTAESQENASNKSQSNINQTILDDWEDTDSQQSEKQRVAMKEAAENVNKLMDDWEEEDEEDKREGDE